MTRRDSIQKIVVGGTIILVTPVILSSCTKERTPAAIAASAPGPAGGTTGSKITIDLTTASNISLNASGGYVVAQGIIVANTGNGNFVALSSICTHQGCTIVYSPSANNFPCPCHGSVFSTSGSVLNGPASTAIKSYPVSQAGNILTIG